MRRIVMVALVVVSDVGLLAAYHHSTEGNWPAALSGGASGPGLGFMPTPGPVPPGWTAFGVRGGGFASGKGSFTGRAVPTHWGEVQVEITVQDGRIATVNAVAFPYAFRRGQEINAYAIPMLDQEAMAAQSADIDSISGATVTSDGYVSSLQSALDAANL